MVSFATADWDSELNLFIFKMVYRNIYTVHINPYLLQSVYHGVIIYYY